MSAKSGAYTNLVTVAFETTEGQGRTLSASVFDGGRDARLVAIVSSQSAEYAIPSIGLLTIT